MMISNLRKVEKISPARKAVISKDWIETAAYFRWEKRGRLHGDHHTDWLTAEKEIQGPFEDSGAFDPDPSLSVNGETGLPHSRYA